jgi:hypothetical protein
MTHYEIFLSLSVTGFEAAVCFLVYARHLQKQLPLFAVYATTLLTCNLCLSFVYGHFGFRTATSYYFNLVAAAAIIVARSAAIAELCRYSLRAYRGIWALSWRILGLMTLSFFVHAALDARGQPNWIATYRLTIERDIAISSAVILVCLFLIGNYYRLPMEPIQKWIALSICFFCIIDFANSTVLRDLFASYMSSWTTMKLQIERVNEFWNTIEVFATLSCLGIWCYALRNPLPALAEAPVLLPAEIYRELSPTINMRLRAFNDRLVEMLKP